MKVNVFVTICFNDGYVLTIDKDCYDFDFDTNGLVSLHGDIMHFHIIVST